MHNTDSVLATSSLWIEVGYSRMHVFNIYVITLVDHIRALWVHVKLIPLQARY